MYQFIKHKRWQIPWCRCLQAIAFRNGTPVGADQSDSECGWLAFLSRQWARRPSALTGPDDIISTGSQWRGESLQWLRANGPDVRATWPAPGLRMLPLTEPVMQSRGSAVCRSPFLRHKAYCSSFRKATVLITMTFFSNFFVHPSVESALAFKGNTFCNYNLKPVLLFFLIIMTLIYLDLF